MKEYNDLKSIVDQLLFVGYKDEHGYVLENNAAFIELQRMAKEEEPDFAKMDIWFNEDGDNVTAPEHQFEGADDFVEKTIAYHKYLTGETVEIDNVDVDAFLITDEGLRGECAMRLKSTDVQIVNCYHADVVIIDEK